MNDVWVCASADQSEDRQSLVRIPSYLLVCTKVIHEKLLRDAISIYFVRIIWFFPNSMCVVHSSAFYSENKLSCLVRCTLPRDHIIMSLVKQGCWFWTKFCDTIFSLLECECPLLLQCNAHAYKWNWVQRNMVWICKQNGSVDFFHCKLGRSSRALATTGETAKLHNKDILRLSLHRTQLTWKK